MKRIILTIWVLTLSACATNSSIGYRDLAVGTPAKQILTDLGAPSRIQNVLGYEVWSYPEYASQECQLFFRKKKLAEPVKCIPIYRSRAISSISND